MSDVAKLLHFKPKAVSYILYKLPATTKYTTFDIPKRNGGLRAISAPIDPLKLLQRRLSALLQDCMDEISDAKGLKDRAAHGFKRKRSILTNARRHRHRRWVFNLDLEDFFPSINFGRVRGFFLRNHAFTLHPDVATVLAQIACHDNSLPQGSPCSPVVSNLIAHLLDMRLVSLASRVGCTYSRYADDLTFSTNKRDFPAEIAVPTQEIGTRSHLWLPGDALKTLIENTGFRINVRKSHLMYRSSRQNVTGLVVNQKINVRWEYRHSVRAMVHRLVTTGQFDLLRVTRKEGQTILEKRPGTVNELHGMLGFIDRIERYNASDAPATVPAGRSSGDKVYRTFLFYSTFYAAPMPVIVCEGDTDNVYLTHAIRSLASEFSALADIGAGGKVRLKVRLYKYPRSSTARLLDLRDGGSSVLAKFIAAYKKETRDFTAPGMSVPVIVLYDNDSGAKPVRDAIKRASDVRSTSYEPFARITKNLWALPTPLAAGTTSSKIEDFFDAGTMGTVIDGKTFHDSNNFDVDKHYGKKVFAHKVVRPKADAIDFGGFRPLLTNLVATIDAHGVSIAASESTGPL